MKQFDKLYIKYISGNKESYDKAALEAKKLGYKDDMFDKDLSFTGILRLDENGFLYQTVLNEEYLINIGYKEYNPNKKYYKLLEELLVQSGDDSELYKIIHVANSDCKNTHDDWKNEIDEKYKEILIKM